jgi:multidrug resistance efflux pump
VTPNKALFREAALSHAQISETYAGAISPPATWIVSSIVTLMAVSAVAFALFGRVDVTARARGAIRPVGGVRPIVASGDGVILEIVEAGAEVRAGGPVARLRSASVVAAVGGADQELLAATEELREVVTVDGQHAATVEAGFALRMRSNAADVEAARSSLESQHARLNAARQLQSSGLLSEEQIATKLDEVRRIERDYRALIVEGEKLTAELAAFRADQRRRRAELTSRIRSAEARRSAATVTGEESVIQAPISGVSEGFVRHAGDYVQKGEILGRIVPSNASLEAVCFVADKDAAFLRPGAEALLELDQYPYLEFGGIRARVVRIGRDLASPPEIANVLGAGADLPYETYPIMLQVIDSDRRIRLRPGMALNARFIVRRVRPVTLLLGAASTGAPE